MQTKMAYERLLSSPEGGMLDQVLLDDSDNVFDDDSDLDDKETVHEGSDSIESRIMPTVGENARKAPSSHLLFSLPAEAKEMILTLVEATHWLAREYAERSGRMIGRNTAAKRTGSLENVEFVQEESDEGEYFEGLMRQGAEEYGDSDENDAPTEGGRGTGTAGHRNPDNVNAFEGSIQLPQLYSRKNKERCLDFYVFVQRRYSQDVGTINRLVASDDTPWTQFPEVSTPIRSAMDTTTSAHALFDQRVDWDNRNTRDSSDIALDWTMDTTALKSHHEP
ncbi:MAG: hypothetical protein J3Q66DRAFT_368379 [Benniella sp.]|nr:MAG: hypothetical protein J3Q66DRAFT_368379 [Benniella sp.]